MLRLYIGSITVLTTLFGGGMATAEPNTRPDPWYQAVVEPMQNDDHHALRFHENLLTLKGAELARKLESTGQEFEKDRSELNRVQLAMLLSLPGSGFRDDQGALNIVLPLDMEMKMIEREQTAPPKKR